MELNVHVCSCVACVCACARAIKGMWFRILCKELQTGWWHLKCNTIFFPTTSINFVLVSQTHDVSVCFYSHWNIQTNMLLTVTNFTRFIVTVINETCIAVVIYYRWSCFKDITVQWVSDSVTYSSVFSPSFRQSPEPTDSTSKWQESLYVPFLYGDYLTWTKQTYNANPGIKSNVMCTHV